MNDNFKQVTTAQDIKALAQAAHDIWFEFFPNIISKEQIEYMVEKFQSENALTDQIKNQGYLYYVITNQNDTIIGFCGIKLEENKLFLSKVYVRREYRSKGYGSRLLDFVFKTAAAEKKSAVYLTVNKGNKNSIAVYNKKGFETVKSIAADIGSGFVMNDYVMEKKINF